MKEYFETLSNELIFSLSLDKKIETVHEFAESGVHVHIWFLFVLHKQYVTCPRWVSGFKSCCGLWTESHSNVLLLRWSFTSQASRPVLISSDDRRTSSWLSFKQSWAWIEKEKATDISNRNHPDSYLLLYSGHGFTCESTWLLWHLIITLTSSVWQLLRPLLNVKSIICVEI